MCGHSGSLHWLGHMPNRPFWTFLSAPCRSGAQGTCVDCAFQIHDAIPSLTGDIYSSSKSCGFSDEEII